MNNQMCAGVTLLTRVTGGASHCITPEGAEDQKGGGEAGKGGKGRGQMNMNLHQSLCKHGQANQHFTAFYSLLFHVKIYGSLYTQAKRQKHLRARGFDRGDS